MQEAELREAIAKPAEKEGWTIPEDLQNEIVKDVQQSPGSLPLLQYLLYELWDWRDRRLTVKTYQDMGGVLGTLQTQADKVYNSLDPEEEKTVAKSIFLELTQLVEEDKPTSRQVRKTRLTDLPPSPEKVETVLGKLEDARLIVTSELQARGNNGDTIKVVDVAHEALIRNWKTLKDWLNDNREIKRQRDELKDKAQEWEEKGKRREGLLRGIDLSDAEAFVRRYGETGIAREYVQKSIRNRRITNILSIGTVATMLSVVTGLWLNAQRQATIANLRANAAQAQQLLTTPQPLGGVVLAIQATGESQDQLGRVMSSVQSSLLTGIQTLREHNRFQGHQDSVYAVAFSPDGETIVSGSRDGTLRLWTRQGEPIGEPLRGHQDSVGAVAFSPDGETIVSGSGDNTLRLWNGGDWKNWLQMACNKLQYHPVLVAPETDTARDAGKTCQKYAWSPTESAQFLVRHGKALARDGNFSGAVTHFNRALKLDDSLDLDPEAKATELAVPALIAQGEELARSAQVEEAREKFQAALKLDDTLDLDPEAEAIEIATSSLVKQGEELAGEGQVDEAIAKFQQAVSVDETLDLDPEAKATKLGVPALVAQGKELASEGKVDEAAAKFQAALKWDETLNLDPESEAIQIATSALVEQGRQLALEGRVDAAVEKFQAALKLDNTLDLDPEAEARKITAAAVADKAKQLAEDRQYKAAIEAYTAAEKLDANLEISALTWNNLCWYGSLRGEAEVVMPACEKAVQLAPNDANQRGNLGIAKALTGDTEGAIQAFETFLELSEDEGAKEIVQGYIDTLRAGENPFTDAEIKRLLGE
jgi:tetratricopeptide (TPR) repeat protein